MRAALAATLGEGADEVQRAAAWALGAVGGDEARPPLVRAVFVKRDDVRRTAELALSRRSLARHRRHARPAAAGARRTTASTCAPRSPRSGAWRATAAPGESAPPLGRQRPPTRRRRRRRSTTRSLATATSISAPLDDLAWLPSNDIAEAALWPRVAPAVRTLATHDDPAVRARVAKLAARVDDVELLAGAPRRQGARRCASPRSTRSPPRPPFARPSRTQLAPPLERALRATDWLERRAAVLAAVPHPELWPDKGARALAPLRHDPSGFVRQAVR